MKRGFLKRSDAFQSCSSTKPIERLKQPLVSSKSDHSTASSSKVDFQVTTEMKHAAISILLTGLSLEESGVSEEHSESEFVKLTKSITVPSINESTLKALSKLDKETVCSILESEREKITYMARNDMKEFISYMKSFGCEFTDDPNNFNNDVQQELISSAVRFDPLVDHDDENYPTPLPTSETAKNIKSTLEKAGGISVRGCRESAGQPLCFCSWLAYNELVPSLQTSGWGPLPTKPSKPSYRVSEIAGKGKALLATRSIEAGETIVMERPLLITPLLIYGVIEDNSVEQTFNTMLSVLSPELKSMFFELADSKPVSHGPKAFRIFETNSLHVIFPRSDGLPHYGAVIPTVSRCNHSCSPNALYGFTPSTLVLELRATRLINKGEEITIAYCEEFKSSSSRQEELKAKYHFQCRCEICGMESAELRKSDEKRKKVASLHYFEVANRLWVNVVKPTGNENSKKSTEEKSKVDSKNKKSTEHWTREQFEVARKKMEHLIKLHSNALIELDAEKLYSQRFVHLRWLVHAYAALGDEKNTITWAAEAKKAMRIAVNGKLEFMDSDRGTVAAWDKIVENVTLHPDWDLLRSKIKED